MNDLLWIKLWLLLILLLKLRRLARGLILGLFLIVRGLVLVILLGEDRGDVTGSHSLDIWHLLL